MKYIALYAILLYAVIFGLEYYLAKLPRRWPGLVLPGITFCLAMMNVIAYMNTGYGNVLTNFITSNAITFILLIMYFFVRRKK